MSRFVAGLVALFMFAVATPSSSGVVSPRGPITISVGGTYSGNWLSTDSTPAVLITTADAVRIVNSTVSNLADGPLIEAPHSAATNVTLDHIVATGGNGRFYEAENFKSITIRNCTIVRTSGISLVAPVPRSSVRIVKNRHTNIQHGPGAYPGNFVQLVSVQDATVEVAWNEIVNQYDRSDPEDLISVYQSAHLRLHDNYFQHQSVPGNAYNTSSQNGITIESGSGKPASFDNEVWNNQIVDGMAIGIYGGYDNHIHDNRVVQDGKLPNGKQMGNGYQGMWIAAWAPGNRAERNVVGYVNRDGKRLDFSFPGEPTLYSQNRSIRGKVTSTTERAEWILWKKKLAVNRIRVGAAPPS